MLTRLERLVLWTTILASGVGAPGAAAQSVRTRPELVVVIQAEGMTPELLARYRASFTGGLGRLLNGTVFTNASPGPDQISRLAEQLRAPGISAVVDGAGTRVSAGANHWRWTGQGFAPAGARPRSRVMPVANEAIARLIAAAEPPLTLPPACGEASQSDRFGREAGDAAVFSASPALDAAVLAVGAGLIGELRMGIDPTPDLVLLTLPATGRAAQAFGPASQASCLQLQSLDRDLSGFFTRLDRGGIDYSVALVGGAGIAGKAPVMFWRASMAPMNRPEAVSTSDVAATVAAWLGLTARAQGRCLGAIPTLPCLR